MTRSKDHVAPNRHDKHLSRNGQDTTMKKMGAGAGNWGVLGDEIDNVEEYVHTHEENLASSPKKVTTVDADTFKMMRNE